LNHVNQGNLSKHSSTASACGPHCTLIKVNSTVTGLTAAKSASSTTLIAALSNAALTELAAQEEQQQQQQQQQQLATTSSGTAAPLAADSVADDLQPGSVVQPEQHTSSATDSKQDTPSRPVADSQSVQADTVSAITLSRAEVGDMAMTVSSEVALADSQDSTADTAAPIEPIILAAVNDQQPQQSTDAAVSNAGLPATDNNDSYTEVTAAGTTTAHAYTDVTRASTCSAPAANSYTDVTSQPNSNAYSTPVMNQSAGAYNDVSCSVEASQSPGAAAAAAVQAQTDHPAGAPEAFQHQHAHDPALLDRICTATGCQRVDLECDWNEQYQRLFEMELVTPFDRQQFATAVNQLRARFTDTARRIGWLLLRERYMSASDPQRILRPLSGMGILGGRKFIVGNIFCKFALADDHNIFQAGTASPDGSSGAPATVIPPLEEVDQRSFADECAQKAAMCEIRALNGVLRAAPPSLHTSLTAAVRYRGHCVIMAARMPIDKARSLVYGSDNAGITVVDKSPEVREMIQCTATALNLRRHRVGDRRAPANTVTAGRAAEMDVAVDCEGHVSTVDGRA